MIIIAMAILAMAILAMAILAMATLAMATLAMATLAMAILAMTILAMAINTVEPLYSGHPWGTTFWPLYRDGRYIGMAFIEGLFCTQNVHLGPGFLATIQRWPLFKGGR